MSLGADSRALLAHRSAVCSQFRADVGPTRPQFAPTLGDLGRSLSLTSAGFPPGFVHTIAKVWPRVARTRLNPSTSPTSQEPRFGPDHSILSSLPSLAEPRQDLFELSPSVACSRIRRNLPERSSTLPTFENISCAPVGRCRRFRTTLLRSQFGPDLARR